MSQMPPSNIEHPECLPLERMTWDRFEAFCCELVNCIPDVIESHNYGKSGNNQKGIDVIAKRKDGTKWAFQSKRHKQFGGKEVTAAIKATKYKASEYVLLLTREATVGARDAVERNKKWSIWDVRDISRIVYGLKEKAHRLVDRHFGPRWRKDFLRLQAVAAFCSTDDFFQPLLEKNKLFNHTHELEGRKDALRALHRFARTRKTKVAILPGRGGVGKSRLLLAFGKEFLKRYPKVHLWFSAEGVPLTQEAFDELPSGSTLIVIDDAHRRVDELGTLFTWARRRPDPTLLLLSTRPQRMEELSSLLHQAMFDATEIERLDELKELTREEMTRLAERVLGKKYSHYAKRLVMATKDSPLITVVGARLLAEEQVAPELLEQSGKLRQLLLDGFQDEILGNIASKLSREQVRKLLQLLAGTTPINPESEAFLKLAGDFLNLTRLELVELLEGLEKSGLLLRRGRTVRITPDVLSDHILCNACLTNSCKPKGYADSLIDRFGDTMFPNIIRNLAELDWRIHQYQGEPTPLLHRAWQKIEERLDHGTNLQQYELLGQLTEVAYYQPEPMYRIVQHILNRPMSNPPVAQAEGTDLRPDAVLKRLLPILERISYSQEHLSRVLDTLWKIGRDESITGSSGDSPHNILVRIAAYQADKPIEVHQAVLEAVRRWLGQPNPHGHLHSPLEILKPLLAKSGYSTESDRHTFSMRPFLLNPTFGRQVRRDAIALLLEVAARERPGVAARAVGLLDDALRDPLPYFGMPIADKDRAAWVNEQLDVLSGLERLLAQRSDALIANAVFDAVKWHARYGHIPKVKQAAGKVRDLAVQTPGFQLCHVIITNRWDLFDEEEDEQENRVQRTQERRTAILADIAKYLWTSFPTVPALAQELERLTTHLVQEQQKTDLSALLESLLKIRPTEASAFATHIHSQGKGILVPYYGQVLWHLRSHDHASAFKTAVGVALEGDTEFCLALGQSLAPYAGIQGPLGEDESRLLKLLLNHADVNVKRLGLSAAHRLGKEHTVPVLGALRSVDIGEDSGLASELCAMLGTSHGIPAEALTEVDFKLFLAKLMPVMSLDRHVCEFLAVAVSHLPDEVMEFMLERSKLDWPFDVNRQAVPLDSDLLIVFMPIWDNEAQPRLLAKVLAEQEAETHFRNIYLDDIFRAVSGRFGSVGLTALEKWINSGNNEKLVRAASYLRLAPNSFVFEQTEFVANLLERAAAVSEDSYLRVASSLRSSATSGSRSSLSGKPSGRDVDLKTAALAAAEQYLIGSPLQRFFAGLAKDADWYINHMIEAGGDDE